MTVCRLVRVFGRNRRRRRGGGVGAGAGLRCLGPGASRCRGKVPSRASPLRAPSSLCQKSASASTFDAPKYGKAQRPAFTAIRERFLRIQPTPTVGFFSLVASRHAPPVSLTRFAGCVMGGFPPPPVARLPRALLAPPRRAGKPTPTQDAAPMARQAGHLRRWKSWGGSAAGAGRKPCPALRAWHPIAGRLARPAVAAKEKYQEALSR